jgi:hypothetical protein
MTMADHDCTTTTLPARPHFPLPLSPPSPLTFNHRKVTVSSIAGHTSLRLQGRWLERAGFSLGMPVRVEVSERRLVVEVTEPKEPLRCSEPHCPHEARAKRRQRVRNP